MENVSATTATEVKGGVPTYGGRYVMYNVVGHLFELSAKYVPPIVPLGRGAYGIVWYILCLSVSLCTYMSSCMYICLCVANLRIRKL